MSTNRLEAFSDGVIAIAITLLVLDIRVPPARPGASLAHALGAQWPSYAAYVVSFATIGVIWINHHATLSRVKQTDHTLLVLNLVLLLDIGILPFTTALMAEYLRAGAGAHLAAAVYAGSLLAMAIPFYAVQRHVLRRAPQLLDERVDEAARARIMRLNLIGIGPYVLATALAVVSPYATLALCAAIALFYALPQTTAVGLPDAREGSPLSGA